MFAWPVIQTEEQLEDDAAENDVDGNEEGISRVNITSYLVNDLMCNRVIFTLPIG